MWNVKSNMIKELGINRVKSATRKLGINRYIHWLFNILLYFPKKYEPSLANLKKNTIRICKIYNLDQESYFSSLDNYFQEKDDVAQKISSSGMSLWHYAGTDYLQRNVNKNANILDICCGLGHFFIYLKSIGFTNFTGIDDSNFQPKIVKAANKILRYYSVNANIIDMKGVSYPGHYVKKKLSDKFDVVTHFGVGTYYLYPIVYNVLKDGGFFIIEQEDLDPGIYCDVFKVIKVYENYGRIGQVGIHQYHTVVMQVIKR